MMKSIIHSFFIAAKSTDIQSILDTPVPIFHATIIALITHVKCYNGNQTTKKLYNTIFVIHSVIKAAKNIRLF